MKNTVGTVPGQSRETVRTIPLRKPQKSKIVNAWAAIMDLYLAMIFMQ